MRALRPLALTLALGLGLPASIPAQAAIGALLASPVLGAGDAPTHTAYMRERERAIGAPPGTFAVEWVPREDIPARVGCALVKAEDNHFFEHGGIDRDAFTAAARRYVRGERGPGGSTISQQLARNLYLSPRRSLRRKAGELVITRALEHELDKARILELYMNVIEWGDGVWGVGPAARHYFAVEPAELDLYQTLLLISLVPAPRSRLAGPNLTRAVRAQRRVLRQLDRAGYVDADERDDTYREIDRVARALRAGRPLAHVLRRGPRASDSASAAPSWRRAIDESCASPTWRERRGLP